MKTFTKVTTDLETGVNNIAQKKSTLTARSMNVMTDTTVGSANDSNGVEMTKLEK